MNENISPQDLNVITVKTEEHPVPPDSGIADLVFMINLYHELDNLSLTVEEANRILRPNGKIIQRLIPLATVSGRDMLPISLLTRVE
jgi:SAM-dependent methyltransferase